MGFPTFLFMKKRMLIMEQMPLKQKKIGTTIAAISTAQGAGQHQRYVPENQPE